MRRKAISSKAVSTKESILTATAHILLKEGIDAANTNRIAEKAGVSIGSLYQYYEDKDEIFEELIKKTLEYRQTRIRDALGLGMVIESFEETISKIVDVAFEGRSTEDNELEAVLIPLLLTTSAGRRVLEKAETFENIMKPIIKALILVKQPKLAKKDLDVVIYILIQSLRGMVFGRNLSLGKSLNLETLKAEVKHLLIGYLAGLNKR